MSSVTLNASINTFDKPITLITDDTADAGDDITLGSGLTLSTVGPLGGADIQVNAGDNVFLGAGSVLNAGQGIVKIQVDPAATDADPGVGGIATIGATITSSSTTIEGGNDGDTFNFQTSITADVNGGAGDDGFNFTNAASLGTGTLDGGAGTDTLTGDDDGNSFTITGTDGGTLAGKINSWINVENLAGGAGIDTFTLIDGTLSGTIHNFGQGGDTLSGNGTIAGDLTTNGGTLSPGVGSSIATLQTGNLTLDAGTTFAANLDGTSNTADRLSVTGTVSLGGATLMLTSGGTFTPGPTQTFTLVDNDGTDAVIGTFAGLAEGATLTLSGFAFKLSYVGGTGNDVTLTINNPPGATDDTATVNEDAGATAIAVLSNDSDPDPGQTLTITGITQGSNGTVAITGGGTGLTYQPDANFNGSDSFTYTIRDGNGGTDTATVTVAVNPVADTPSVTNATTNEDTQTTSGLVITRNAADGAEVTHFKITNITNGTLFLNDGTTAIVNNSFITFAQANEGLKFTPNANFFGTGSFDVQASTSANDAGLGGSVATANITVNTIADTPSVTNATTNEDTQTTSGLVISRNAADGSEVTHFKITNISNGTLFLNDGTTAIADGSFITFAQANAGLKFTPNTNFNGTGSFEIQASVSNTDPGLGGSVVTASIAVNAVNDPPTALNLNPTGLNENVPPNTVVGTFSTTDPDDTTFTYALVAGQDDDDNGAFTISGNQLRIDATPDFETQSSYSIRVRTTDQDELFYDQVFAIAITDLNEAPTSLGFINPITTLAETTTTSTRIQLADLMVTDDALGTQNLSLSGADASAFEVDKTTLYLKAGVSLDFETQPSYSVTINVDDPSVGTTPDLATPFTLNLTDALDMINGTPGPDNLVGASGADQINGFAGNDSLQGLGGNDTLNGDEGDDTLDGSSGNDTLNGGSGNDFYLVEQTGDRVQESTNAGVDRVRSSFTYTLGSNLEDLVLAGTAAINGTGNPLANQLTGNDSNNQLTGQDGNDTLKGGAGQDRLLGGHGDDTLEGGDGNDTLEGGAGNDFYIVDQTGDQVQESTNADVDRVRASLTYTLGNNLENLVLAGTTAINGTGNSLANQITGNDGNNWLTGQAGNDTLIGGLGWDEFVFNSKNHGIDWISDFSSSSDTIRAKASGFGGGLTAGTLASSKFVLGTKALDADDRFIYNQGTGRLYFDGDGTGNTAQIEIAFLANKASFTHSDIVVF